LHNPALKLYEVVSKTKSKRLKCVLNSLLSERKKLLVIVTQSNGNGTCALDKANYLRSTIKFNKEELEFKYLTARKTFGKSSAVTMQQKTLINRYMKFTDYLLENIPLNKQVHEFKARELLDLLEIFYINMFGPEWLNDKDGFMQSYSKLTSN
jgi:hypothetical protein